MFAFQNYNLVLVLQIVSVILNAALNSNSFNHFHFKMTCKTQSIKNTQFKQKIGVIFKLAEWLIYLAFCIVAGLFVKDVLDQFQAKATFMGQSLKSITKLPTVVFCLQSKYDWKYGWIEIGYGIVPTYDTFALCSRFFQSVKISSKIEFSNSLANYSSNES